MTGHDWTSPDVLPVYAKFELQCSEASVATHHRRLNTGTPPGRWQRCVVAVADGAVYIKNQGSVLPKASTWGMERQQGTHQPFSLCGKFFSRTSLALADSKETTSVIEYAVNQYMTIFINSLIFPFNGRQKAHVAK